MFTFDRHLVFSFVIDSSDLLKFVSFCRLLYNQSLSIRWQLYALICLYYRLCAATTSPPWLCLAFILVCSLVPRLLSSFNLFSQFCIWSLFSLSDSLAVNSNKVRLVRLSKKGPSIFSFQDLNKHRTFTFDRTFICFQVRNNLNNVRIKRVLAWSNLFDKVFINICFQKNNNFTFDKCLFRKSKTGFKSSERQNLVLMMMMVMLVEFMWTRCLNQHPDNGLECGRLLLNKAIQCTVKEVRQDGFTCVSLQVQPLKGKPLSKQFKMKMDKSGELIQVLTKVWTHEFMFLNQ